ncbi:MAG: HD domain-containing protein [Rhodomicrobiaceae bacterium]
MSQQIADGLDAPVDRLVLLAAAFLHDIVAFEKNDPQRHDASRLAAEKSRVILTSLAFPPEKLDAVMHAIEAHSFRRTAGVRCISSACASFWSVSSIRASLIPVGAVKLRSSSF